ncbi:O-antigen ligase family protein [Oscillospiraceae bacterium LTW-04]|nr:O-antigen ligase family protein [Oscillospiraceae bacterium MB24-C1]
MTNTAELKIRNYKTTYDSDAIALLGCMFLFYSGSYSIKVILSGIGLEAVTNFGSLFFYILWFYNLVKISIQNKFIIKKIVFFELLYIGILMINKATFPYTEQYYIEYHMFLRQIVLVFLPCGVVLSQVKTFEDTFGILRKYAWIGSLLMLTAFPLGYMNYWGEQYWGVQLSPLTIIIFENYIKNKRKSDFALLAISLVMILAGGRQSFIVISASCLMLYLYDNRKKSTKILLLISLGVIVSIILVSDFYIAIFKCMLEILQSLGLEKMRALEYLANGNLFSTLTRNYIYESAIVSIAANGTKVSGLFADRYYIRQFGRWIAYPHNLFLELWMDFGTVWGTVLAVILMAKAIENLFIGGEGRKRLYIALSILSLFRLMVSNSFMIEGYFYVLLGFLFGKGTGLRFKNPNKQKHIVSVYNRR